MVRTRSHILAIALLSLAAGCAGLGTRVERVSLPEGAPKAEDVLRDLARNDARIKSFRAGGVFVIASPKLKATKQFSGNIYFRRPADLYVQGNQQLLNIPIFKLICVGTEFLMEFPGSRDQSFYQVEGEQFEDIPFSVSPSDIAREMFLPEQWGVLKPRDARVVKFDPVTQTATLAIGNAANPRRLVEVARMDNNEPVWAAKTSTLLKDTGEIIAVTTLDNYKNVGGALFPTVVNASFPTEKTRMKFTMRKVKLNEIVADRYFNIRERARELHLAERHAGEER